MSDPNNEISNTGGPASSAEPSMEEILASIRRILKDEQSSPDAEAPQDDEDDDVLLLDATMMVQPLAAAPPEEPEAFAPEPILPEPAPYEAEAEPMDHQTEYPEPEIGPEITEPISAESETAEPPPEPIDPIIETAETEIAAADSWEETTMSDQTEQNVQPPHGLVSEAASNAAAGSIGALIRSISSDRSIAISRPGLTLEDLVREELRPLLKAWLDSNLPPLVERIVRAEIQRVVERSIT